MLSITSAQLDALILTYVFPMVRVMSFLAIAPLFSNVALPKRVKLIAALAIGFAIASSLPTQSLTQPGSYIGIAILGQQILIGSGMGFSMRIVFSTLDVAGELIGLQMGFLGH